MRVSNTSRVYKKMRSSCESKVFLTLFLLQTVCIALLSSFTSPGGQTCLDLTKLQTKEHNLHATATEISYHHASFSSRPFTGNVLVKPTQRRGLGEERSYNPSSYLLLSINISRITSLTGCQRPQLSNYKPEKHQQPPPWQKKNKTTKHTQIQ